MSSSAEGPNPLRPYYVPPSIGLSGQSTSQAISTTAQNPTPQHKITFGSSARDLFSDFDYSDYLGEASPSVTDSIKEALDKALWRYSSVLMSQPFEVAKTILQVYVAQDMREGTLVTERSRRHGPGYRGSYYEEGPAHSSDSDDDESSYFTSTAPLATPHSVSRSHRPPRQVTDRSGYILPTSTSSRNALKIRDPSSLLDVLSQLWTTNGPTSIWKASNSTFIYSLLLPTLNSFIRGLLSAILGFPEDGFSLAAEPAILTSTSPGVSLILTCISSALASILLSPVDTARTYLILTPSSHGPRSLLRAVRRLPSPSYLISAHLLPITVLNSTLPNLVMSSTPIFLKSYLSLDPLLNPSIWSFCTVLASGLELGLRFPLETVLRRAQIATFTSPSLQQRNNTLVSPTTPEPTASTDQPSQPMPHWEDTFHSPVETIVPTPQVYRGIIGTMWGIVYEEGATMTKEGETVQEIIGRTPATQRDASGKQAQWRRRGQGVQGLYRGWRLGMWSIVGIWGSGFLGTVMASGEADAPLGAAGSTILMSSGDARGTSRGQF